MDLLTSLQKREAYGAVIIGTKNSYLFKLDHDVLPRFLENFTPYVKRMVTTSNFHLQLRNDCINGLPICLKNVKGIVERCYDLILNLCLIDIKWNLTNWVPIDTPN